jgi:hypothetical protein
MGSSSRQGWRRRLALLAAALAIVAPLSAAACRGGGKSTARGQEARPATSEESLRGICPSTIVIQLGWWPEASDGPFYQLLGKQLAVDSDHKRVTGPLVSRGVDTGVRLELRSGGPAVDYTHAADLLAANPDSIFAAAVDGDYATQFDSDSRRPPVVGVFAPLNHSPIAFTFDPKHYPTIHSLSDIGLVQPPPIVHTYAGSSYAASMVAQGVLKQQQVVADYQGQQDLFINAGGKDLEETYASNEPKQLEDEIPQWHKPVKYVLLWQGGPHSYDPYVNVISILKAKQGQYARCLRRLVPAFQYGEIDYLRRPDNTNQLLSKLNHDFIAYPYPISRGKYAVDTMRRQMLMSNGPGQTVGQFDQARVAEFIEKQKAVAAVLHVPFNAGMTVSGLYDNEFLASGVGF